MLSPSTWAIFYLVAFGGNTKPAAEPRLSPPYTFRHMTTQMVPKRRGLYLRGFYAMPAEIHRFRQLNCCHNYTPKVAKTKIHPIGWIFILNAALSRYAI